MKRYICIWEIDIEADTPEEAAEMARQAQHEGTWATVFTVKDCDAQVTHTVDLHEQRGVSP